MRHPADWGKLDLSGDPILVVGRRPRPKMLEAFVVDLHEDTFDVMRAIAGTTIERLASRYRVDWHPYAAMEPGEQYLAVPVGDLPSPLPRRARRTGDTDLEDEQVGRRPADPLLTEAASLLRLVLVPGDLDNLHPERLAETTFRFYAAVWARGDGHRAVAFVSEYDATAVLRKASSFFRFEGTLRLAAPPDLALNDGADLVVTTDEVAILSSAAFDHLFSDISALLSDVPAHTQTLKAALTGLPVSAASLRAIEQVCATRPSLARRLLLLATSPTVDRLTASSLRTALRRHGQRAANFVKNDTLDIGAAQVGAFLDIAEGRWYEADFTNEPRRADRWSRRVP
jgi:hypothetical protein